MCQITQTKKNIFTVMFSDNKHDYYFVNPVNTIGIMGKGLAKEFKKTFPSHFELYKKACKEKTIAIGKVLIDDENQIIAFPTKEHWRGRTQKEFIKYGLRDMFKQAEKENIKNIFMPRIGSGLGGLDFDIDVLPIIKEEAKKSRLKKLVISKWVNV